APAPRNSWDATTFEAIAPNDRPRRMPITPLYARPFGPGRRFGSNTSAAVARLIEGWQYNVIGEITSGTPIGMASNAIPLQNTFSNGSNQWLNQGFGNSTKTHRLADGTHAWDLI